MFLKSRLAFRLPLQISRSLLSRRISSFKQQRNVLGCLDLLSTQKTLDPITAQWYGQPVHETHPSLVESNDLVTGIQSSEFDARRAALVEKMADNSMAVVFSSSISYYSPNVFYPFRQNADFFYLTGWNEPNSVLVIEKSSVASRGYKMVMFVLPKDPTREMWDGPRSGIEEAVNLFGADEAYPINEFDSRLKGLTRKLSKKCGGNIYVDFNKAKSFGQRESPESLFYETVQDFTRSSRNSILSLSGLVDQLRLIKSKAEIDLMQQASVISGFGYKALMEKCKPGINEDILASTFEYYSKLGAADRSPLCRLGYVPVFASGDHGLVLHYVQNNTPIKSGELLLIDAGMEYAEYMSDISRTIPVNGKFSEPQADLYDAVLEVQEECIKRLDSSSGESLNDIHNFSEKLLFNQLVRLGFKNLSMSTVKEKLYPHHISHYLGLNVHDTGSISRSTRLKPGMAITVEPGIYVPYSSTFPKHFRGISIRIEDNIIIGNDASSNIVLSSHIPKTIKDIESNMHSS
ncbi:hypothetical protein BB561_005623 [Smittium simulii]|uniref:Aminopeptidase P N-terminal domain-containing protein n=1 Tax=Smittium simulii TaxID=133385 RepID=A0A2T9Y9G8_9FUNG|nr:hypothetical protein BB561_005623 [Smittium simulii]